MVLFRMISVRGRTIYDAVRGLRTSKENVLVVLLPPRRSASGEGIVVLRVCVSVCPCADLRLHSRRISLGGEVNALYPVLSS